MQWDSCTWRNDKNRWAYRGINCPPVCLLSVHDYGDCHEQIDVGDSVSNLASPNFDETTPSCKGKTEKLHRNKRFLTQSVAEETQSNLRFRQFDTISTLGQEAIRWRHHWIMAHLRGVLNFIQRTCHLDVASQERSRFVSVTSTRRPQILMVRYKTGYGTWNKRTIRRGRGNENRSPRRSPFSHKFFLLSTSWVCSEPLYCVLPPFS